MRDASGQAQKLCPEDPMGYRFYYPRGVGVGKARLFLSRSISSSLLSGEVCIQIRRRVVLKPLPLVWVWMQAWCHLPPEAILKAPLTKEACLVLMVFLSSLLIYSDLPMSPKFPSLNVVLYQDFYNYLCLLHPYHYLSRADFVFFKRLVLTPHCCISYFHH